MFYLSDGSAHSVRLLSVCVPQPTDIVGGIRKLNLGFVAQIFNTCTGLNPISQDELSGLDLAGLEVRLPLSSSGVA